MKKISIIMGLFLICLLSGSVYADVSTLGDCENGIFVENQNVPAFMSEFMEDPWYLVTNPNVIYHDGRKFKQVKDLPEVQAQGLSPDIVAVEPLPEKKETAYENFMSTTVYPALWNFLKIFVGGLLTLLTSRIYEVSRKWLATTKYGQEVGILLEATKKAVSRMAAKKGKHYKELLSDLARIFSDFKITPEEKEELKKIRAEIVKDAVEIAREDLKELRGHVAGKGAKYIAERIDMLLGELESQVLGFIETYTLSGPVESAPEN